MASALANTLQPGDLAYTLSAPKSSKPMIDAIRAATLSPVVRIARMFDPAHPARQPLRAFSVLWQWKVIVSSASSFNRSSTRFGRSSTPPMAKGQCAQGLEGQRSGFIHPPAGITAFQPDVPGGLGVRTELSSISTMPSPARNTSTPS